MAKNSGKQESEPVMNRDAVARRRLAVAAADAANLADTRNAAQSQMKVYEQAVRLFHARKFSEARELFVQAKDGPNREMAHNADLHIRMCDRRLESVAVDLKTVEEHYNYAVAMINTRNLPEARQHLERALQMEPQADYILYALSLCKGLDGDLEGAYGSLKRAIELEPRNRISARQDADFALFIDHPQLQQLLFPEKAGSI